MCGLIGGWLDDIDPISIERALNSISHRGPDGRGIFQSGDKRVFLGHVRLAIIDISSDANQPMYSDDGRVVIIFNGEIYNYQELRKELQSKGVLFNTSSDTEVLLRLYLDQGLEMLPRLNGIFSMAIYDQITKEMFLIRDRMGVKPLYYTQTEPGVVFGSEIKGIMPLIQDERDLDLSSLHRYMTYLWCPGSGTPLKNIKMLPPGHIVRVKDCHIEEIGPWYQSSQSKFRPDAVFSEGASIKAVRTALRQAVHRQMVADTPVGAFLSGGLDSSAIVAFAREQVEDLHCFTIEATGPAESGFAEDLPYARRVADHLGVKLDVVSVSPDKMAGDLEAMVWHLDEPLADLACLNVLYISQLARENGIKVLLSGSGGDDLFTGYRRHVALQYERYWDWLPLNVRRYLARFSQVLSQRSSIGRRLGKLLIDADKPRDARLVGYFAWQGEAEIAKLFSADLRDEIKRFRPDQPFTDHLAQLPSDRSPIERILSLEQQFFLADHNLLYTDKMSMAAGVEVRVPFLDADLVELAACLPDRFKQRGRVGKWVLKKALEGDLPQEVIWRPKTGFGVPLRRWLREDLREFVGDILSEASIRKRGLFDPAAVSRLIEANQTGTRDCSYTVLSLLCIEIWCRRFLDT